MKSVTEEVVRSFVARSLAESEGGIVTLLDGDEWLEDSTPYNQLPHGYDVNLYPVDDEEESYKAVSYPIKRGDRGVYTDTSTTILSFVFSLDDLISSGSLQRGVQGQGGGYDV